MPPSPKPTLTAERDRFVAFAFAAADLLLEVDEAGRIVFAAGSSQTLLGRPLEALPQSTLAEVVAEADRPLVSRLLAAAEEGRRRGPILVTGAATGRALEASLFRTPGSAVHHVVVNRAAAAIAGERQATGRTASGLLAAPGFTDFLGRRQTASDGESVELSLVRVAGIETVEASVDEATYTGLMRELGALLRLVSVDGDSAGELGPGRFAILHRAGGRPEGVEDELARLIREVAPGAEVMVAAETLALRQAMLSAGEARQALGHVLELFAEGVDGAALPSSLGAAFKAHLEQTMGRVKAFRESVRRLDFDLVFQPIVGLAEGRTHHYEALTRFADGRPTFELVNFAEGVGIVADFDLAVARKAVQTLFHLAEKGQRPEIAVNISARSLQNDVFVEQLMRQLGEAGKLARNLLFEVTESAEIADLERADAVLQRLRRAGHAVCLDDFGAGAAAFHYIRALTVDYVKIDGGYVDRMDSGARDLAILSNIQGLCRSLAVPTIAEKVETEAQRAGLIELGIAYGQGFLFGRPEAAPTGDTDREPPPRRARRRGAVEEWA